MMLAISRSTEKLSYRYLGKITFFGDRVVARTGGAEGPVRTMQPRPDHS
jgi:hypothetical protein